MTPVIEALGSPGHPVAGRYLLVDRIGAGATGSVWRAWDLRERRWCAAKVLTFADGAPLLRLVREDTLRLRHPHIAAPFGWAAEEGRAVLVMDLVHGGTLADLGHEGATMPAGWVAVLLDQLLDALDAVHAAGLVHRDVTPANLLLEATGAGMPYLRLGDFGIAARIGSDVLADGTPGYAAIRHSAAPTEGTPGYIAPEGGTDPRIDLYAAGRLARALLGSRGGPLDELAGRLAADDPADRPASAAQARAELHALAIAWQPGPEVPDRIGSAPVPPDRPRRLRELAAIACSLGVIAVCAIVLIQLMGR